MAKEKREKRTAKEDIPKAKLSKENFKKSIGLFKYLGDHRWMFVAGMIFLVLSGGIGLVFPMFSGKMFGVFGDTTSSPTELTEKLQKIGIILLAILASQGVFSFCRIYFFTRATEDILMGVRKDTYSKLIQMPMSFFSKNQVTELSARVATDIGMISDAFTVNIAEVIRQSIVGIGGLGIILVSTPWEIARWFLIIIPPISVITIFYARRIRKFSKQMQDKISEANVIVGESLMGINSVKAYTNENFEINRYVSKIADVKSYGIKFGILRGAFFTFIISFLFGAIFFILYKMIQLKIEGTISAEQFGTFMMLSLFVATSLGGLPEQIASVQRALGATDRIFEFINGDIETINLVYQANQNRNRVKGDLEFKNIKFVYPTRPDFTVLHDISFSAKAGQTIALVGSSGSGKSTLASLALRFYEPTAGEYIIDGKKSTDYELTELRDQMAIVPQDVLLFGGTIKENILYGRPNATEEEVIDAARQANAYDFIMSFPDKFETLVGDRGIQLSGGQRQRVAIARAVLKNPSILILDEATSSLDSESERLVQDALDKLMIGRTSIVIAHRLSTIRKADKIIVLQKGQVVETGTHQELMTNDSGLYQKLSKLQLELN
jgi:ABC-type multidrug transport system fused ATPase/permease subunit